MQAILNKLSFLLMLPVHDMQSLLTVNWLFSLDFASCTVWSPVRSSSALNRETHSLSSSSWMLSEHCMSFIYMHFLTDPMIVPIFFSKRSTSPVNLASFSSYMSNLLNASMRSRLRRVNSPSILRMKSWNYLSILLLNIVSKLAIFVSISLLS